MAYGKSRYNAYRKRSFNRSDTQRREYAQAMDELEQSFELLAQEGWSISSHLDSATRTMSIFKYDCPTIQQITSIMIFTKVI